MDRSMKDKDLARCSIPCPITCSGLRRQALPSDGHAMGNLDGTD